MTEDLVAVINRDTACQNCKDPLGASPSNEFCSEPCQTAWRSTQAVPLVGYQETSAIAWSSDQFRHNPGTHYEIRPHDDGYMVFDVLHDYPVADIYGEIVVWPDRYGPLNHIDFLYKTCWEPLQPAAEIVSC